MWVCKSHILRFELVRRGIQKQIDVLKPLLNTYTGEEVAEGLITLNSSCRDFSNVVVLGTKLWTYQIQK